MKFRSIFVVGFLFVTAIFIFLYFINREGFRNINSRYSYIIDAKTGGLLLVDKVRGINLTIDDSMLGFSLGKNNVAVWSDGVSLKRFSVTAEQLNGDVLNATDENGDLKWDHYMIRK
jgi:hypothetical protein